MQSFYILYARATPRHKWHLYTYQTNVTRALLNYRTLKQEAPSWEFALATTDKNTGDIATIDNLRAIPFALLDIETELSKPFLMICPSCAGNDPEFVGSLYNDPPSDAGRPEYITWDILQEAGGYVVCEYCETRLVLAAEYKGGAAK